MAEMLARTKGVVSTGLARQLSWAGLRALRGTSLCRPFSGTTESTKEGQLRGVLETKLQASEAVVEDISGGCGSMYKIVVESPLFAGKGLVAQHRMVKDALKEQIADMHGLTLQTRVPK